MVVVSMSIGMGIVGLVVSLLVVALFEAKVSLKLVFLLCGSRDNQVMVGLVGELMSGSVSGLERELADELVLYLALWMTPQLVLDLASVSVDQ